jgi:HD-GYP domain-containing protein (c-di-GMP phosphodiesterase class II)
MNEPAPGTPPQVEAQSGDVARILAILGRANRIASMTSLEDLLSQMLDLMIEISGATNGTLYLLDHEAGELIFMVVRGNQDDQRLVGRRIKENVGIVGFVVQHQQQMVINDLSSDPRWYRDVSPELTARLRNAITFPLLLQSKAIGAVQIFNFEHADLELLQVLGDRMASEVDKVLMLEKTRHSNQRLKTLVDALGQIAAVLDRDSLINLLADYASRLLDAETASVFLADSDGESGATLLGRSLSAGSTQPSRRKTQTGSLRLPHSFLAHSAISAPLRARPITLGKERLRVEERVIGSLMALNKQHGDFDDEDTQLLEIMASQASTLLQVAALYSQAQQLFVDLIKVMTSFVDAKDPYTRGHSLRVSTVSIGIGQELGIKGDELHNLSLGSLLHDIGKIGVADYILTKPEKLTADEYDQVKRHPGIGYKIILDVHLMNAVLPAIVEHHERLDGRGYPFGLRGQQISLMGRIVAAADVYDALTTDRPYRKAMQPPEVLDYMRQNINIQFDADCVAALASYIQRSSSK